MTQQSTIRRFRLLAIIPVLFYLAACDMFQSGGGEGTEAEGDGGSAGGDLPQLTFAAPKYIPWLPWFLAESEGVFQQYGQEYGVDVSFLSGDYDNIVNQFVSGEVEAAVMTNIDAIAQLIRRNIPTDVILISSYSNGNDAILLPAGGSKNIAGENIAVKEFSIGHYLLDRYLLKNQIDFDGVTLVNSGEAEIEAAFDEGNVAAAVTWNPLIERFVREKSASVLFDSRQIPHELSHILVVRRETLEQTPNFAKALLATWFTMMERLQGNRQGATLDALAALSELDRAVFDAQFNSITLIDTPVEAISTLRDRRIKKTMRHIRYFIERYELAGTTPVSQWVSYPGREATLLHFNAKPLQDFVTPEAEET